MFRHYRFRPGWTVSLAVAVVLPGLVGLGLWQLDRAREKAEIREQYATRVQLEPIDLNREVPEPAKMEFRRAVVEGRYRPDLTIFLDNRILRGKPGYEVLTPLEILGTSRFILVNRGWIPWGESRQKLPDVDTPTGGLVLSGRLAVPAQDYFTLEKRTGDPKFQSRWQNLDLDRYRRATGLSVAPAVLHLDPDSRQDGDLVRQWPEHDDHWIQRHRAYAAQWFGLACVLLVLYVALNLKTRDASERAESK